MNNKEHIISGTTGTKTVANDFKVDIGQLVESSKDYDVYKNKKGQVTRIHNSITNPAGMISVWLQAHEPKLVSIDIPDMFKHYFLSKYNIDINIKQQNVTDFEYISFIVDIVQSYTYVKPNNSTKNECTEPSISCN